MKTKQRVSTDTLQETKCHKYKTKAHLLPGFRKVMDCKQGAPLLNLRESEDSHRQTESVGVKAG